MSAAATATWRLVAAKELADMLGRLGRRPLTRTVAVVAIFAILVPSQLEGLDWLPPAFALFMTFLPARLVAIDALAGERERGTLEVLLASPVPDAAIAHGKIAAATVYGVARGWLFVAVWALSAWLLGLVGLLPGTPTPTAAGVVVAVAGALVVAYAASVVGVWQSAAAPSVRAIAESGGLIRLLVIVVVVVGGPWLAGRLGRGEVLAPAREALAGGAGPVAALGELPTAALTVGGGGALVALIVGGLVLVRVHLAAVRRCRRDALLLVDRPAAGRSVQPPHGAPR